MCIIWERNETLESPYFYFADSLYSDEVTQIYTGQLLRNLIQDIKLKYPNYVWDPMGLNYFITKPLMEEKPFFDEIKLSKKKIIIYSSNIIHFIFFHQFLGVPS